MKNKSLLKLQAYWITFISYAAIHALRMCYSFNKVNLQRQFQLTEFYLALLDAIMYLSYGLGAFVRYEIFEGNQSMTKVYFITSMLISICFGGVASLGLFRESEFLSGNFAKVLLSIGVLGFGFFHLAAYQICGAIVSGYYDADEQSHKIGFWGSNASVGNIIGFLVSNLLVYELNFNWEVSFLLFSIINLLMAFAFYFFIQMPEEDQTYKNQLYQVTKQGQQYKDNNPQQVKQIRTAHWLKFVQRIISASSQARYTYLAYMTIKAAVYTFLMWFPIFLVSKNLESVSGYISTLFDVGGTIGGYLIGKWHKSNYQNQNSIDQAKQSKGGIINFLLKYRYVIFVMFIIGLIISFMTINGSLIVYCPLTLFMGFFLGGMFNNISSHQIFKIAENRVLLTDMLLNFSVGISCLMVGFVQLITAFLLKFNNQEGDGQQAQYGVIFLVLLILMCLCGFIMLKRVFITDEKKSIKMNEEIDNVPPIDS